MLYAMYGLLRSMGVSTMFASYNIYTVMNQRTLFFLCILFLCIAGGTVQAQKFSETEVLSGAENIWDYGIDTTSNWWAVTMPFTNRYRLTVNGKQTDVYDTLAKPVFAPDGKAWAVLGIRNSQWHLVANGEEFPLPYNHAEEIVFSADSRILSYLGYRGDEAWIVSCEIATAEGTGRPKLRPHGKPLPVLKKTGPYFVNPAGNRRAYVGVRSGSKIVSVEGKESFQFDDVLPIGFWYDGSFLYGGRLGPMWKLYKDGEELTGSFTAFSEGQINAEGTVAAFIGSYESGSAVVVLSDEYYDPVIGERFNKVMNLSLHPTLRMYACNAVDNSTPIVLYNGAKYATTLNSSIPRFTWNGNNLVYMSCDIECAINVDGKQYPLYGDFNVAVPFAVDPTSNTFAYVSSTSLAVRRYTSKDVYMGLIVDEMSVPRYNRRAHSYEMLGRINQRLYLITCKL